MGMVLIILGSIFDDGDSALKLGLLYLILSNICLYSDPTISPWVWIKKALRRQKYRRAVKRAAKERGRYDYYYGVDPYGDDFRI
jgi:hypothetical protein